MSLAYIIVNALLALGMAWCAYAEFTRFKGIPEQMAKARVPLEWLPALATVKVVALIGVLVGFWVPAIGILTAGAVVVYFLAAIAWHIGAHDSNIAGASFFLVLAASALVLRTAAVM